MWFPRFPWLDITGPCSDNEDGGKTVDRERESEVGSETGIIRLFQQLDDAFAFLSLCGGLLGSSRSLGDHRATGFCG
jgi:hypothetical protein